MPPRRAGGQPLHPIFALIPRGRVDDATLDRCTAFGPPEVLVERLEQYVGGGGSKFIVRPMGPPETMLDQIAQLAEEVVPLFHAR